VHVDFFYRQHYSKFTPPDVSQLEVRSGNGGRQGGNEQAVKGLWPPLPPNEIYGECNWASGMSCYSDDRRNFSVDGDPWHTSRKMEVHGRTTPADDVGRCELSVKVRSQRFRYGTTRHRRRFHKKSCAVSYTVMYPIRSERTISRYKATGVVGLRPSLV